MTYPPVSVKVWGEFACFTRPEMHTERVSYETPTPSAARGILEAIFWHKPMQWRVREIRVLKTERNKGIRHFSILRNEVNSKASAKSEGGISITEERAQRHSLILRDVAYVITADAFVPPGTVDRETGQAVDPAKYRDQFRRRVERGQCFQRPSLGCREFAADFGPVSGSEETISVTADLGRMLFDMDYSNPAAPTARFFEARLEDGVLRVPPELYGERSGQ